jgi:hypothetical protein
LTGILLKFFPCTSWNSVAFSIAIDTNPSVCDLESHSRLFEVATLDPSVEALSPKACNSSRLRAPHQQLNHNEFVKHSNWPIDTTFGGEEFLHNSPQPQVLLDRFVSKSEESEEYQRIKRYAIVDQELDFEALSCILRKLGVHPVIEVHRCPTKNRTEMWIPRARECIRKRYDICQHGDRPFNRGKRDEPEETFVCETRLGCSENRVELQPLDDEPPKSQGCGIGTVRGGDRDTYSEGALPP